MTGKPEVLLRRLTGLWFLLLRSTAVASSDTKFDIPAPMTQERLEEILLEFGLVDSADDYHI